MPYKKQYPAITTQIAYLCIFIAFLYVTYIRISYFPHISGDYTHYLEKWLAIFADKGFGALKENFTDYNFPYLYLLWLFNKIPGDNLYKIKIVSSCFDVTMVIIIFKLIKLKYNNLVSLLGGLCIWSCPTLLINSSGWGQCDSIYTFFLVLSLYYLIQRDGNKAAIAFATSFVIKFHAIFLLPFFGILYFNKNLRYFYNIKFYYIIYPVLIYYICSLPVLFIGHSFGKIILLKNYFHNSLLNYTQFSYDAPNIYYFLPESIFNMDKNVVIPLMILVVIILFCIELYLIKNSDKFIYYIKKYPLLIAQLFTILFIFLLPKMHDRYFYICDILSIVIFFYYPSPFLAVSSIFIIAASFFSYNLCFNFYPYFIKMEQCSVLMLVGILFLIFDVYHRYYSYKLANNIACSKKN